MRAGLMVAVVMLAACVPPSEVCEPGCRGCCRADGTCADGLFSSECGSGGSLCSVCTQGQTCVAGACRVFVNPPGSGAGGGGWHSDGGGAGGGTATGGGSATGGGFGGGGGSASGGGSATGGGGGSYVFTDGGPAPFKLWMCFSSASNGGAYVQEPGTPMRLMSDPLRVGATMAISDDGTTGFVAYGGTPNEVARLSLDGGAGQTVYSSSDWLRLFQWPSWSWLAPDKSWLLVQTGDSFSAGMVVVPLDGGTPVTITPPGIHQTFGVARISHDGRYLAYGAQFSNNELDVYDTTFSTTTRLTPVRGTWREAATVFDWTHGGDLLAVGVDDAGYLLQRCSVTGACTAFASHTGVIEPVMVAPDDAFAVVGQYENTPGMQLFRAPLDGGTWLPLAASSVFSTVTRVTLSPDGARVAVVSGYPPFTSIFVVPTTPGPVPAPVLQVQTLVVENIAFSPDSKQLALGGPVTTTYAAEVYRVYDLDAPAPAAVLVGAFDGGVARSLAWSW